ncbi:MAG: hypothetical protein ACYC3X_10840 [Pirellulaceae bacterium]
MGFGLLTLLRRPSVGSGSKPAAEETAGAWSVLTPHAPRWVTAALAATAVLIPLGALLGKEMQERAKHTDDLPLLICAMMLYVGVGTLAVFLSWQASRHLRSHLRSAAKTPSAAVLSASPSPRRTLKRPELVFVIGVVLLMSLVVIAVFIGVLGGWMK